MLEHYLQWFKHWFSERHEAIVHLHLSFVEDLRSATWRASPVIPLPHIWGEFSGSVGLWRREGWVEFACLHRLHMMCHLYHLSLRSHRHLYAFTTVQLDQGHLCRLQILETYRSWVFAKELLGSLPPLVASNRFDVWVENIAKLLNGLSAKREGLFQK